MQPENTPSKRAAYRQELAQRLAAGQITQVYYDARLQRMEKGSKGRRAQLRQLARLTHKKFHFGSITLAERNAFLASIRAQAAEAQVASIPEAEENGYNP